MSKLKCYACGKPAMDTCPLCGKSVCRHCAEREGDFCCDGEPPRDPGRGGLG